MRADFFVEVERSPNKEKQAVATTQHLSPMTACVNAVLDNINAKLFLLDT